MALRRPLARAAAAQTASAGVFMVRVADVLAELAGQPPGLDWDADAERVFQQRADGFRDWSGRPVITWAAAEELLREGRAAQAAAQANRAHAPDSGHVGLSGGVVGLSRPGEPEVLAPWMQERLVNGRTEGPR